MKLNEYFTDAELACKCGCGLLPEYASVRRLYALRVLYNKPMTITSAARCVKHNADVGGAAGSSHVPSGLRTGTLKGKGGSGYDVRAVNVQDAGELERAAITCGFKGIGRAPHKGFLHIDDADRTQLTFWDYK